MKSQFQPEFSDYQLKLKHPKWQRKRLEILNRDEFKCTDCGDEETELHIHHLEYENKNNPWEVDSDNLTTLCKNCHEFNEHFKNFTSLQYIKKTKVFFKNREFHYYVLVLNKESGEKFYTVISKTGDREFSVLTSFFAKDIHKMLENVTY